MKKKLMLLAAFSLAVSAMVGCSSDKAEPKEEKEKPVVEETEKKEPAVEEKVEKDETTVEEVQAEVEKVINDNLKFAEEEDIDAYMGTLSKEYSGNAEVTASTQVLFDAYDIDYEVIDVKVVESSEEQVTVEVKQKAIATKVEEGYTFQNHIATAVHTLVKEDGQFKFSVTETLEDSIEYLDEEGNPIAVPVEESTEESTQE